MPKKTMKEKLEEYRAKSITPETFKAMMRPIVDQALGSGIRQMLEGASGKELRIEIGPPCEHTGRLWYIAPLDPMHTLVRLDRPGHDSEEGEMKYCPACGALLLNGKVVEPDPEPDPEL